MEKENEVEEEIETKNDEISANPNPKPPIRSKSVTTKVPEVEIQLFNKGKGPIEIFKSSLGGWDQDRLEVVDILEKYGFKSLFAYNQKMGRGVPIRFNARNGRSLITYKDGSVIFVDGEPKEEWWEAIEERGRSGVGVMRNLRRIRGRGWRKSRWELGRQDSLDRLCDGRIGFGALRTLRNFCRDGFQDSLVNPITKIVVGIVVITILIALALKETPDWVKSLQLPGGMNFPPWILALVVIVFIRLRKRTRDFLKKFGW
ncbi:hypothetical protein IFM89_024934 [Coptis chinensis]|uniref:Uncharacterized protein n=1 Tax=Coptis chinensis TaxID=261450 RepID=A0A835I642_9MAGN|nr:hypothetical protein IFM89_024934 [Coptis chinensis]